MLKKRSTPCHLLTPLCAFALSLLPSVSPAATPAPATSGHAASATAAAHAAKTPADAFQNHGPAAPVGQAGWIGVHASLNAKGERVVLVKLWTGSGASIKRRLLRINADTGTSTLLTPEDGPHGDGGYATFLSSRNRLYDTVGKREGYTAFYEYDANSENWLAQLRIKLPGSFGSAMGFTETGDGTIYISTLGNSGGRLLRYLPDSQKLTDLGPLVKGANWLVYPQLISDSSGWIYAAIRHKEAHIIAYHPDSGMRELLPQDRHTPVLRSSNLFRADNGKAYIQFDQGPWYELFGGELKETTTVPANRTQYHNGWKHSLDFGDGSAVTSISVANRTLDLREKDGSTRTVTFDYDSAGATIYALVSGADGNIYGSTGQPLRFFRHQPQSGLNTDWGLADYGGHINALLTHNGSIYGAVYSYGSLIRIDTQTPWHDTNALRSENPKTIYPGKPDLFGRPFTLHLHTDGEHLLMGGNPYRGKNGGGMLVYSLKDGSTATLDSETLVPAQGVKSLLSLKDGTVIGGSTTDPATGSTAEATEPEIFVIRWPEKTVSHRHVLDKRFTSVLDIISADGERAYAVAGGRKDAELLVLDKGGTRISERISLGEFGLPAGSQAANILSLGPDGRIYLLLRRNIVSFAPGNKRPQLRLEAQSPVAIGTGSAWVGNRLYFSSGSDLWSWTLQAQPSQTPAASPSR